MLLPTCMLYPSCVIHRFAFGCRGFALVSFWQDMMHGTLEVKQEGLTAEAVKRPEWMDEVAADAMTEEQRKVRKQHENNIPSVCKN